jgi:hypothetical protein
MEKYVEKNKKLISKMMFIYNCLENGWNIEKKNDYYILRKKHQGEKKYIKKKYLSTFIKENINLI